jgi:hypothetical protein
MKSLRGGLTRHEVLVWEDQMADEKRRELGLWLAIAEPLSFAKPESLCIQDNKLL